MEPAFRKPFKKIINVVWIGGFVAAFAGSGWSIPFDENGFRIVGVSIGLCAIGPFALLVSPSVRLRVLVDDQDMQEHPVQYWWAFITLCILSCAAWLKA
jgi:hypothetical protein